MLKGFKLIQVYGNASESAMTITGKYFKFNADTAIELGNPNYINMMIDTDGKRIAIVKSDEKAEAAVKFFSPTKEKKNVINVAFKAAHAAVRNLMGWNDDTSYRVIGFPFPKKMQLFTISRRQLRLRKRDIPRSSNRRE